MLRKILYIVVAIFLFQVPRLSANEKAGISPSLRTELTKSLINTATAIEEQRITNTEQSNRIQAIAKSLARLGETTDARQIAQKMIVTDDEVTNGVPFTLRYINRVTFLREINQGNLKQANELIAQFSKVKSKIDAYIMLADAQNAEGKSAAAYRGIIQAEKLVQEIKEEKDREKAFIVVAKAYLRLGKTKQAQKVLLQLPIQVPPIERDNFRHLLSVAVLLSQSGDIEASKTLFAQAKARMLPWEEKKGNQKHDKSSKDINDDTHLDISYLDKTRRQHQLFASSLLRAGFFKDWQEFIEKDSKTRLLTNANSINWLVENNHIDKAIDITQGMSHITNKIPSLAYIAIVIAPQNPDKALSLINQAAAMYDKHRGEIPDIRLNRGVGDQFLRTVIDVVYISMTYKAIGKPELAQKRLKTAIKDLPKAKQAIWQIQYLLFPQLRYQNIKDKSTFTAKKLASVNMKLQKYLPSIKDIHIYDVHNLKSTIELVDEFIDQQIKAGQIQQARGNLEYIDKLLCQFLEAGKGSRLYNLVDSTAQHWIEIGEKDRAITLLEIDAQHPDDPSYSSINLRLASKLIRVGLIGNAIEIIHQLSPSEREEFGSYIHSIGTVMGRIDPKTLPTEFIDTLSLQEKATFLSGFTSGLTEEQYQRRGNYDEYLNVYFLFS